VDEPDGGGVHRHRGGGRRAQDPHHGGVHIAHHGGHHLFHNGGPGEPPHQSHSSPSIPSKVPHCIISAFFCHSAETVYRIQTILAIFFQRFSVPLWELSRKTSSAACKKAGYGTPISPRFSRMDKPSLAVKKRMTAVRAYAPPPRTPSR